MASSLQLALLFSFTFLIIPLCVAQSPIVLPVTKDVSTLQYVTQIYKGTDQVLPIKLLVDLGGPFILVDAAWGCVSSSHRLIRCGSLQCSMVKTNQCRIGICNHHTCGVHAENPITGISTRVELAEDIIAVGSNTGLIPTVHSFLFSCAPTLLLEGLASGVEGILGLGRGSKIALPNQLATTFGFHRKFSLCLSPASGLILSGSHHFTSGDGTDVSKSLIYTPLVTNYKSRSVTLEEYYISVKSIKINGMRLSINKSLLSINEQGVGGTKISTIVPYTTMESTLYEKFTKAYIKIATSMNMTMVAPIGPFRVCFSSKGIDDATLVGPTIDLVLQSEMVKWRFYGRNSMVKMSDEAMCLGFLDGGLSPNKASIVIGGYQLEDNLLEFDLGTSMLGFSSSLLLRRTSCSDFKLYSMPKFESLRPLKQLVPTSAKWSENEGQLGPSSELRKRVSETWDSSKCNSAGPI